mmetsp:Transcript_16368/g.46737  ORF Transcript_16368/g.46737 Transcript_16368/m.46737 type:complete len:1203 (-) Transcript_16368:114-3722(-)
MDGVVRIRGNNESVRDVDWQLALCIGWNEESQTYRVQTLDGLEANVPEPDLEAAAVPPLDAGGFDVVWPVFGSAELDGELGFGLATSMAECLAQKGFCIAQMCVSALDQEEALDVAASRRAREPFKQEYEMLMMGRGNDTKAVELPAPNFDREAPDALARCNRQLTEVSELMAPLTSSMLGFEYTGLSYRFARLPYKSSAEADQLRPLALSEEDVEIGTIEQHLVMMQRRKVCMLYMIDNDGGSLKLFHKDGSEVVLPVTKNKLVLFRHDRMSFEYKPKGLSLALQTWMLSPTPIPEVTQLSGPTEEMAQVMGITGPTPPKHEQVQVMSTHTRFPGESGESLQYWNMLKSCTDGYTEWPFARFDFESYYTPDGNAAMMSGKSYTKHGGFCTIDEVMSLDNKHFRISDEEAQAMSCTQKMVCEVGYQCLALAGFSREKLDGKHIGIYLGDWGDDFRSLLNRLNLLTWHSVHTATGLNLGVTPSRLGYVFNLRGPTMSFDTACSAALTSTHHGHMNMINFEADKILKCDGSLAGGVNVLAEGNFIGGCSANMLSHEGRCWTFDRTADGYERGEGCGFMYMKLSNDHDTLNTRLAALCGSCVNQDGRSASLTAPNGPSQQAVIRKAMRMANIEPEDVGVMECHGTGTALGDPIEVGAIHSVMEADRDDPLPHTSAKSNIGHLETSAGAAGLIKCILMVQYVTGIPNVHLKSVNPHLDSGGFPQLFQTELLDLPMTSMYCGVSSFGYGGTNARGEVYGRVQTGFRSTQKCEVTKIDFTVVSCPRCLGHMCWLCGAAVPSTAMKVQHRCSLIRDEFADYEHCSNCYGGAYNYGELVEDSFPWDPGYGIYISGTWNSWSDKDEMERTEDRTYVCVVTLGLTQTEEFRLFVNGHDDMALYPAASAADSSVRVLGPDENSSGMKWVIDGRADGVGAGTLYRIIFRWDEQYKTVSWEPISSGVTDEVVGADFRHRYDVLVSCLQWQPRQMSPSVKDGPGVYRTSFNIGASGAEEFQIMRDRNNNQIIYPAQAKAEDTSVVILGPDEGGSGKCFLVRGPPKEFVTVKLWIVGTKLSITLESESNPEKRWEGDAGEKRSRMYDVTGAFNNWRLSRMQPDMATSGVYRYRFMVEQRDGVQFNIIRDQNRSFAFHPMSPEAAQSDEAIMVGPDGGGEGFYWVVFEEPGTWVEIVLDLNERDKRKSVSWAALDSFG